MVSIIYFKYEVVSDIKIIAPEDDNNEKFFNFCYWITACMDKRKYESYLRKYGMDESKKSELQFKDTFVYRTLTFEEQFDIAIREDIVESNSSMNFVHGNVICHHIPPSHNNYPRISSGKLRNVKFLFIKISEKYPNIDMRRHITVAHEDDFISTIVLSSFSFHGKKLKTPYADRCIDFKSLGLSGRIEATTSCIEQDGNQTKVSNDRMVLENETDLLKYRKGSVDIFPECLKYDGNECDSHEIFTQLISKVSRKINTKKITIRGCSGPPEYCEKFIPIERARYEFVIKPANQPSFSIISKPKIDDVDLITYILGALGSWIGFSFWGINPIPYIFNNKEGTSEWEKEIVKNRKERERDRIDREKDRVLMRRCKDKMIAMSNEIAYIRSKID